MNLQLENILKEILRILHQELNLNQQEALGVIVPFKTEKQAQTMLYYLLENKDNKELMRVDKLLKVRAKIAEEN